MVAYTSQGDVERHFQEYGCWRNEILSTKTSCRFEADIKVNESGRFVIPAMQSVKFTIPRDADMQAIGLMYYGETSKEGIKGNIIVGDLAFPLHMAMFTAVVAAFGAPAIRQFVVQNTGTNNIVVFGYGYVKLETLQTVRLTKPVRKNVKANDERTLIAVERDKWLLEQAVSQKCSDIGAGLAWFKGGRPLQHDIDGPAIECMGGIVFQTSEGVNFQPEDSIHIEPGRQLRIDLSGSSHAFGWLPPPKNELRASLEWKVKLTNQTNWYPHKAQKNTYYCGVLPSTLSDQKLDAILIENVGTRPFCVSQLKSWLVPDADFSQEPVGVRGVLVAIPTTTSDAKNLNSASQGTASQGNATSHPAQPTSRILELLLAQSVENTNAIRTLTAALTQFIDKSTKQT